MEYFTSMKWQKLNNHFLISRARKWRVKFYLILKDFLVRGRVSGALARTVARTTLPLLKKYVLPAA